MALPLVAAAASLAGGVRGGAATLGWLSGRLWPPAGGSRLAAGLGACPGRLGQGARLPRQGARLPRQGARLRRQRLSLPHRGCLGRFRGGGFGGGPRGSQALRRRSGAPRLARPASGRGYGGPPPGADGESRPSAPSCWQGSPLRSAALAALARASGRSEALHKVSAPGGMSL